MILITLIIYKYNIIYYILMKINIISCERMGQKSSYIQRAVPPPVHVSLLYIVFYHLNFPSSKLACQSFMTEALQSF